MAHHIIPIIVASGEEETAAFVERVAAQDGGGRVVASVRTDADLLEAVSYRRPELAFVSTDLNDMRGFDIADRLSREYPRLYIVMLSPRQSDVEDLRRAMKVGARECLFAPLGEADILRVIADARTRGASVKERRGVVVAVTSSKGGVGKSTTAVNLAIAASQLQVGRVALVDGDLYFGDIATLLNIKPERTVYDLSQVLDAEIAHRFLYHHEMGIEVLAAPRHTEEADGIAPERFREILSMLRFVYDYIIVDLTVADFAAIEAMLDVTDVAIIVATLDVACLKSVRQMLNILTKLRFPSHNVILIGNRYDERLSLSPQQAEREMSTSFALVAPHDRRIVAAANLGVPFIIAEPAAPFSQKMKALAKMTVARVERAVEAPR
jgi:pilus assembly protein CpaE